MVGRVGAGRQPRLRETHSHGDRPGPARVRYFAVGLIPGSDAEPDPNEHAVAKSVPSARKNESDRPLCGGRHVFPGETLGPALKARVSAARPGSH